MSQGSYFRQQAIRRGLARLSQLWTGASAGIGLAVGGPTFGCSSHPKSGNDHPIVNDESRSLDTLPDRGMSDYPYLELTGNSTHMPFSPVVCFLRNLIQFVPVEPSMITSDLAEDCGVSSDGKGCAFSPVTSAGFLRVSTATGPLSITPSPLLLTGCYQTWMGVFFGRFIQKRCLAS